MVEVVGETVRQGHHITAGLELVAKKPRQSLNGRQETLKSLHRFRTQQSANHEWHVDVGNFLGCEDALKVCMVNLTKRGRVHVNVVEFATLSSQNVYERTHITTYASIYLSTYQTMNVKSASLLEYIHVASVETQCKRTPSEYRA